MWKPSSQDQALPVRRIGAILRGTGPSGTLAAEARTLMRMERTVHRILGRESIPHVRAAGLTADTLTLLADSPAWASIIRFRVPDICAEVRSELPRIRHARIAVAEAEIPVEPLPPGHANPIPSAAAHVLRSVAKSIDNPRLARILVRLAGRERPDAGQRTGSASAPPSSGLNRR